MNQISKQVLKLFFLILMVTQNGFAQSRGGGSSKSAKPLSYSSGASGVLFDIGVYYGQSEAAANPSAANEWKDINSIYDTKLGYITDDGFYLGAEYSTRTQSATSTNLNSTTGNTAAAGLGYFWGNGFNLRAYYRINESYGDYRSGSGFQGDLGYMINMSSSFYLGFMVSHRQVTFAENKTIAGFDFWTRKETFPFLSLGFLIK